MKAYGSTDSQNPKFRNEDDSRKARRWTCGYRSVSPKTWDEKRWKKRARRASKEAVHGEE